MIGALIAVGYLFGWATAVGPTLRWYMLREVCTHCQHNDCFCTVTNCSCICSSYYRKPRGAVRERTGKDVAAAISLAFFWLFTALGLAVAALACHLGHGIKWLFLRLTPLTGPELERRERERAAEIDRLTQEINGRSK